MFAGMLMQDRLQCWILQIPGSEQSDSVQPVEATNSIQLKCAAADAPFI